MMIQKFASKHEKHSKDNERRKDSLQKKLKEKQNQIELIKKALSAETTVKGKKIIFDEAILDKNEIEDECKVNDKKVCTGDEEESGFRKSLFADSENDEEEEFEIKIKNHFEGKGGHKLLNLQSNYNNDERFKLDERFKDDDDDGDTNDNRGITSDEECDNNENSCEKNKKKKSANSSCNELEKEKAKQLKVLESVLGPQTLEKTQKKSKRSFFEMVRFDALNEDHRRQDNNEGSKTEEHTTEKKKRKLDREEHKKRKKEHKEEEHQSMEKPSSKNEKFYEVSNDLKMALKNRTKGETQFSLLSTFSRKGVNEEDPKEVDDEMDVVNQIEASSEVSEMSDDERGRTSPKHEPVVQEEQVKVAKAQGIAKEKFFFTDDDPRIEDGLGFINMKDSEEARKALENYDETRKDIREVLRLRWQKHRQRNNPFKKKIGGRADGQKAPFGKNRKGFGKPYTRRRR